MRVKCDLWNELCWSGCASAMGAAELPKAGAGSEQAIEAAGDGFASELWAERNLQVMERDMARRTAMAAARRALGQSDAGSERRSGIPAAHARATNLCCMTAGVTMGLKIAACARTISRLITAKSAR